MVPKRAPFWHHRHYMVPIVLKYVFGMILYIHIAKMKYSVFKLFLDIQFYKIALLNYQKCYFYIKSTNAC